MEKFLLQIFGVLLLLISINGERPANIAQCAIKDNECKKQNINLIFSEMFNGNNEFGLNPLDPILIENFSITGDRSAVQGLNIVFKNCSVTGLKDLKVLKIKGFGKNPEGRHELLFNVPKVSLQGNYEIFGKFIVISVDGEGYGHVDLKNTTIHLSITAGSYEKDGKIYLDVKSTETKVRCDGLFLNLSSLFKNNDELTKSILEILNQNGQELFEELNEPIFEKLNKMVAFPLTRDVFAKTPYNELFQIPAE